ncbi:MAG: hypothetical protein DHS20C16_04570 [Phycisphaerae bacterium]|nr:MAG: hypothetical protein DHS20C16_04570 [Phycisphaerae bacterium]
MHSGCLRRPEAAFSGNKLELGPQKGFAVGWNRANQERLKDSGLRQGSSQAANGYWIE